MRNPPIGIILVGLTINLAFSQEVRESEEKYTGLWLGVMQVTDQMSMQLAFEIIIEEEESYSAKMNVIEQKALELNPLSYVIRYVSGAEMHYNDGHFIEALAEIQKCHELHENHPWLPKRDFQIYWQLGEEEKAYEALRKIFEADSIYNLETAEKIYKKSGLKAVIDWKLIIDAADAENGKRAYSIASTYGMIGEDEKAMDWLERESNLGKILPVMIFNIHFKNLHNNPRYIAILKKMGLEIQ